MNSGATDREGGQIVGLVHSRYHGIEGNEYPLPNDSVEHTRLDNLHHMFRYLLGHNVLAPIGPNPIGILDVGAGSGRWVVEVAEAIPTTVVTGLDLSPIAPPEKGSKNVEFLVGDLADGLKFDDGSLELVHSR